MAETDPVPTLVSRFAYNGAPIDLFSERKSKSWRLFADEDEARLLEAWTLRLTDEERAEALRFDLATAGPLPPWSPDPSEAWPGHLVACVDRGPPKLLTSPSVGLDRLLTVDLKRLILCVVPHSCR